MKHQKELYKEAMTVLKATSRTFFIPITFLEKELKTTVGTAYLCMRAIDEIEDDEKLPNTIKAELLHATSQLLLKPFDRNAYLKLLEPYRHQLPEVTLRLSDWLALCPEGIRNTVASSTSEMADGMAKWASKGWHIQTKEDLDEYTYYVAGLVGTMLSDIWLWGAGIKTDRELAIGYGRGLQAVNILRNQSEDKERGVQFIPDGWTRNDLFQYAEENLAKADQYNKSISKRSILMFCKIPLALAHKTLDTMRKGNDKMTRKEVEQTVEEITSE
ncbi:MULTISPECIES: squalene/phytoene synthase family protein [Rummeliibacillus]|uniref:squalene/phytoene synthase family protein n=1 Tax=Rummeliibacillus TaxID=648802 RepID=UPI00164431D7|nr:MULTISPECIES: phytoene/squalene synthase family protein [Rummeliibacillus]MBO2536502.1 phytoene/squalene synthase family protein [Rummeliibacillus suwonensis]